MTVDNTEGSYDGRLYFSWLGNGKIKFKYSADHGVSFSPEQELSENLGEIVYHWFIEGEDNPLVPFVQGSMPAVAPNGDVYVLWMDVNTSLGIPDYFKIRKSTDGGDTFGDEITVTEFISRKLAIGNATTWNIPSLAIDQLTGNLYVAYMDYPNLSSLDRHIKFIRSTDGGSS